MNKSIDFLQENKSALFDWMVFVTSFSLGFIFPSLLDLIISPWFSYLILSALLLYVAGAWLKHFPLYYRLNETGNSPLRLPFILFLIIGHWCLMLVIVLFSISTIRRLAGIKNIATDNGSNGYDILISIVVSAFITWLIFRSKPGLKKKIGVSAGYLVRRELVADICLVIAVSIFSFAFWEKGIMAMLANRPTTSFTDIWFLFIFLAIAYMLCYLPMRYLFLVEDHFSSKTWKRMLLIFGLLLLKSLLEMINI